MPRRKKSDETSDATSTGGATRAAGKRGDADLDRAVKRKNQLTPRWWIYLMVTFMVVGLAWIVVFYLSSSLLPVPGWDNWNLVAGFGLVLVGFAMTTRWR